MKQFTLILLVFAFLLPNISQFWILVDFEINQSYISEVLCINKDKPIKACNGKCYLSNELEKQEKKQLPQNLKTKNEVLFFNTISITLRNTIPNYKNKAKKDYYINFYSLEILDLILHPPQIS